MNVIVYMAPGYADQWPAVTIPGLEHVTAVDSRGELAVILDESMDPFVVPSRHVFTPEGLRYAIEWAAKSHCSVFDVTIPEALEVR